MTSSTMKCISPIDGSVYVERALANPAAVAAAVASARAAQREWRATPIADRQRLLGAAVDAFVAERDPISAELTRQMGRPIAHSPFEVGGFEERARHMIEIAPAALADVRPTPRDGFERYIRRDPLGLVLVMAPWNYPYLTAVNAVVPALMAGNAVLLKHSAQTPLCAERFGAAFAAAGLPAGLFQHLHLSHQAALALIAEEIDFVAFTGSVPGGHAVQQAASGRFIATGLELGGKDPAYVRADADVDHAVANVMDGVFFNAGQSCCGIERVYVHADVYQQFVDGALACANALRLGDPLDPETTIGPMVPTSSAALLRGHVPAPPNPPPGGRFHPRRGFAEERCRRDTPPVLSGGAGHAVACHVFPA